MAITNSGMTLYADHDTQETWSGTDDLDDYNTSIQGTNSESWIVSKNATETGTMSKSANMGTSKYFTVWLKSDLANYYTSITTTLLSTTGNQELFTVASSSNPFVTGEFHASCLQFGEGTSTGTLDRTGVTQFIAEVNNSTSGNIRSVTNTWIDTMHYGDGRTIAGTTTYDAVFAESNSADIVSDEYDGCTRNVSGIIYAQTDLTLNTTIGNSYNEVIVFESAPNTDNAYTLAITGTADFQGTAIIGSGCTVEIDATTATSFDMDGGSVTKGGEMLFTSGQTIENISFNQCKAIVPNGCTMTNCSITRTAVTMIEGALEITSSTDFDNLSNITFNSSSNYLLRIPASVTGTITLNNFTSDGQGTDIYWMALSGTLTVNKSNGTNFSDWYAGGTATVNIVSSVSIDIHVEDQTGTDLSGALVYVDEDNTSPYIINTTSDVNGDVSGSYSGASTSCTIRIRKYGYKPYTGTASLLENINLNVTLITDPQQT